MRRRYGHYYSAKAHNLVRHEDMPRIVFRVLWDGLKAGRPVAAYVKNRTKSGQHYWVFAVAFPVGDELFSVDDPAGSAFLRFWRSAAPLPAALPAGRTTRLRCGREKSCSAMGSIRSA